MGQMMSLTIILLIVGGSEIISKLTKGKIPSVLILALMFIFGFWTILPQNIMSKTGITSEVYTICSYFILTDMATAIPVAEMKRQWKTVIIGIMGILGICLTGLTIAPAIFGWKMVLSTIPSFAGGAGAIMVMQETAQKLGAPTIVVMALIAGNAQILIGYPLTNVVLKKEALRLKDLTEKGQLEQVESCEEKSRGWAPFIKLQKFSSPSVLLLKLAVIALISTLISNCVDGKVSALIFCLIVGYIGSAVGFLEPNILEKANADGFCMTFMIAYLFSMFSAVTAKIFFLYFFKILVIAAIVTVGMWVFAMLASKIFKDESFYMCMGIMLTCYHGFPVNIILTNEAINSVITDEKTKAVVSSHMLTKMLIGGFTTVTFVSVFVASICSAFLAGMV